MRKMTLVLTTTALALSGAALAQTPPAERAPKPDTSRAEAMAQAEAAFARMDANGDGTIDASDKAAMQTRMFERLDADRSGSISQAEFAMKRADRPARADRRADAAEAPKAKKAERHAEMFRRIDTNRDGRLSRAEFDAMSQHRGERGAGAMAGAGKKRGGPGPHHAMMGAEGPMTRQSFIDGALSMFDRADTDRNGTVTQAERKAARDTMRERWSAKKAQGES